MLLRPIIAPLPPSPPKLWLMLRKSFSPPVSPPPRRSADPVSLEAKRQSLPGLPATLGWLSIALRVWQAVGRWKMLLDGAFGGGGYGAPVLKDMAPLHSCRCFALKRAANAHQSSDHSPWWKSLLVSSKVVTLEVCMEGGLSAVGRANREAAAGAPRLLCYVPSKCTNVEKHIIWIFQLSTLT